MVTPPIKVQVSELMSTFDYFFCIHLFWIDSFYFRDINRQAGKQNSLDLSPNGGDKSGKEGETFFCTPSTLETLHIFQMWKRMSGNTHAVCHRVFRTPICLQGWEVEEWGGGAKRKAQFICCDDECCALHEHVSASPDSNILGTSTFQKWQRSAFSLVPTCGGLVSMVRYSFFIGLNSGHFCPSIPGYLQGPQPQPLTQSSTQESRRVSSAALDISGTDPILMLLANKPHA